MTKPGIADPWVEGGAYDRYMGRWSRRMAPLFLAWLDVPPGLRWLDVGCGTGALCDAILHHARPAMLTGVEPSDGFLDVARERLPSSVRLCTGSAASIPLQDGEVDAVVSALMLNFVPDVAGALAEMARVARTGGTVAAYVWDYAAGMEMLRRFWDAAVAADPAAASLDEGRRFPLCREDALRSAFEQAGFGEVTVGSLEMATAFTSFDDYWDPFLGAQGPAPAYVASLSEAARVRLREELRARTGAGRDGPVSLRASAWAVRGTTPRARAGDDGQRKKE